MATLNGRIVLITGAARGIGAATARRLATEGAKLVLADQDGAGVEKLAAELKQVAVKADVTRPDDIARMVDEPYKRWGRLDVLFNNAGRGAPAVPMEDLTYEQWKDVIEVNLTGMFLCAQAAFRMMKDQIPRGGRIINNGSISAHTPRPGSAPYTATKHGVTGLTKTISLDGRQYDIACGQVDIGNAISPMTERMAQGVRQANGTTAPEPRMDPAHVGNAVVFMANLPLDVNVFTMTIMATKMPFVGRG